MKTKTSIVLEFGLSWGIVGQCGGQTDTDPKWKKQKNGAYR